MRQDQSLPLCAAFLSLESEGVAPHEVLGSFQAPDFSLLYSKANCIRTHLGICHMISLGSLPYQFTVKTASFPNGLGVMDVFGNLITHEAVAPSMMFIYAHKVLGTFQSLSLTLGPTVT